jgi:MinD-like ATPase involved in chromosome partitioning or flagellar assembly/Tfp pilus assembly protein PilF
MLKFPYIFTFYSFKGGVGRSLALLNVAYTLAGRGRHVLVVDMDLEAPGISTFLLGQKELAVPKTAHPLDVLALLSEAIAIVKAGGVPKDVASNLPPISNYIRSVAEDKLAPLQPKLGQLGRLDVVVADRDQDYWRRWAEVGIQGLPQDQLVALSSVLHHYFKAQRFAHRPLGLEPFEPALPTPYDYVLVDSRTGITELGGLCVGPLADRLIVVTGLNDQNVQGTLSFMEEAGIAPRPRVKEDRQWDEADARSTDEPEVLRLGPKPTLVVASPVPSGEIDFKRARLEELRKRLGIRPIPLSYHPQMALLESVFVRDYPEEYLALEYGTLTDRIMAQVSDHPAQLAQRSGLLWDEKKATAEAIACAVRLTPHQPVLGTPLLRQLGNRLESSSDEEFWAERQLHALLSQDARMKPVALNKWANALRAQARTKQGEVADRLFGASYEKYAKALTLKPDKHEALNYWGAALSDQAKTKQGEPADRLFEAAYQKFAEALTLKPDNHEALSNWGAALSDQAKTKQGEPADRLFEAACQKYAEALKLKPDFHQAFVNWGAALSNQAKTKQGEAADRLYGAAYEKYAEAQKLKPDYHETLNDWGAALSNQSRLKTGAARQQLRRAAREKLLAAEHIRPGGGAYNLACFEAGESNVAEAINWLKQNAATGGQPSKKQVAEDTDFDAIRRAPEFAEFLNSLPEA